MKLFLTCKNLKIERFEFGEGLKTISKISCDGAHALINCDGSIINYINSIFSMMLMNLPDRQTYVLVGFKMLKFNPLINFCDHTNNCLDVYYDVKINLLISNDIEIHGAKLVAKNVPISDDNLPVVQKHVLFYYNSIFKFNDRKFNFLMLKTLLRNKNFNNIKLHNEKRFNIIVDILDKQIMGKSSFNSILLSLIEIVLENTCFKEIDVSFIDKSPSIFINAVSNIMMTLKSNTLFNKVKLSNVKPKLLIYHDNEELLRKKFQNSYRSLIDMINKNIVYNNFVLFVLRTKVSFLEKCVAEFLNKKIHDCPLKSIIHYMQQCRINLICEKSYCNRFTLLLFRKLPFIDLSYQIIVPMESTNMRIWLNKLNICYKMCHSLPNGQNIWLIAKDFYENGLLGWFCNGLLHLYFQI